MLIKYIREVGADPRRNELLSPSFSGVLSVPWIVFCSIHTWSTLS